MEIERSGDNIVIHRQHQETLAIADVKMARNYAHQLNTIADEIEAEAKLFQKPESIKALESLAAMEKLDKLKQHGRIFSFVYHEDLGWANYSSPKSKFHKTLAAAINAIEEV